jgi:hypothetical protein
MDMTFPFKMVFTPSGAPALYQYEMLLAAPRACHRLQNPGQLAKSR